MVKKLLKKTKLLDVDAEVILDSAEILPFPDNSFDSVVVTLVLCMVDNCLLYTSDAADEEDV